MQTAIVSSTKWAELGRRMAALGVSEDDLEEQFVRAAGPGGQKVNKSSSCVLILHRPTGLRVKCQQSRHRALNRFLARRLLLEKVEATQKGYVARQRAAIAKIRRQKARRSRRAKERILADKSHRAEKKALRRKVEMP